MGAVLIYLIKSSLTLLVAVALFMLLMSRETFHRFNRWLLIAVVLFSLLSPAVNIGIDTPLARFAQAMEQMVLSGETVRGDVATGFEQPTMAVAHDADAVAAAGDSMLSLPTITDAIMYAYFLGVIILALRLIYMYVQVILILRRGRREDASFYTPHKVRLSVHSEDYMPFSWFGNISVSRADLAEAGREIITHEAAHIRCGHSWDILFADIVIILHWFNPMAWIMKSLLKDIHEYEADSAVLAAGVDAKSYQLLIIKKAVGSRLYSIANSFNHSLTKKRITMMCKEKSSLWHIAKSLYIVPLAVVAACTFSTAKGETLDKVSENVANNEIAVSEIAHRGVSGETETPAVATHVQVSDNAPSDTAKVYQVVEHLPQFPGGTYALMKYMREHIVYPKESLEAQEMGKTLVAFVVEKDGSISDVKVARTSGYKRLDDESVRMVSEMPKWQPGKHKGVPVRVRYIVPVTYKLVPVSKNANKEQTTSTTVQ